MITWADSEPVFVYLHLPIYAAHDYIRTINATTAPSSIPSIGSKQFWLNYPVLAHSYSNTNAGPPSQHTSSQIPTLLHLPSAAQKYT